ncbi:MAG: SAM-dependent methyltransferase [Parachlamydiaceae bacterium]|nr:SAM-dependent methyltransferase [Parachlamydiaceae bacterium]
MSKPALLLLPNLLGEHRHHEVFLPASVDRAVETLDGLIAESEQGGRRFLSRFKTAKPATLIPIALLNEHTPDSDMDFLLEPIRKGERWGLVSDGGVPCVADPGAKLVQRARQTGINVQAFVGPSSIMLSLMLSGLSGQRFVFHGYLPKEPTQRKQQLKRLEQASKQDYYTQIFIEAPYRNQHALEAIMETLSPETLLCVAWDLTLPTQGVLSQPIEVWKKSPLPNLEKKPAIFLIASPEDKK